MTHNNLADGFQFIKLPLFHCGCGVPALRFLSGTLNIYPWSGIYANKFLKNQNYFKYLFLLLEMLWIFTATVFTTRHCMYFDNTWMSDGVYLLVYNSVDCIANYQVIIANYQVIYSFLKAVISLNTVAAWKLPLPCNLLLNFSVSVTEDFSQHAQEVPQKHCCYSCLLSCEILKF